MERYDAIIIGSGQAGNPLAMRLASEGKHVAIVESAYIGGTCINSGCTPTKTLVGLAKNIAQARKASDYGIILNNTVPDYRLISQRKKQVVSYYREGLENRLLKDPNITLYHGKGKFSGHKEVSVQLADSSFKLITADRVFINTGARPRIPDIEGIESVNFLTSESILDLEYLPEHLIIAGGGYVALEFAQVFRRLGSHVTIIEKSSRLLPKEDEDVGLEIARILEAEGIQFIMNASIKRIVADTDKAIVVEIFSEEKSFKLKGSDLLVATGRKPNTEDLDLPKTGIQVDEKGFVPVNEHLETTKAGIYALGDVKGGAAFTHVSYHDFIVLAENLFDKKASSIQGRLIPYCIFIDPELGRVGLTEKQAAEMGLDFSVAKMKTSFIARAVETGETSGFIKAILDNKTKKILGVAVIWPSGGELMSLLQVAMMGDIAYDRLRDSMFAHPTYAEAINNLFQPAHIQPKTK